MNAAVPLPAVNEAIPDALVLSAALEACSGGFALLEDGRVEYASQVFAQAFGFRGGPDVRQAALSELLPGAQTRADVSGGGASAPLHFSCSNFQARGRDWQVISLRPAVVSPVHHPEERRLEAVGRLVSGVAHDFNNLLTGMLLYCDLLREGLRDRPQLRRHVEEMRAAAERGATLIRQLLDVARPQPDRPEALSWNDAVNELAGFLRRLIGENIRLVTEPAPNLGRVNMGPAQMQQVVLNLVLNARDAMPQGGRVTLATRNCGPDMSNKSGKEPDLVEFSVSDTGSGMDADTRARLFQPFFTTKPPGVGNGIGLATVHAIVQKAHGTLQVESEPGKGTRVVIRLPRAARSKSEHAEFQLTSFDSADVDVNSVCPSGVDPIRIDPDEARPSKVDLEKADSTGYDPSQPRGNSV